MRMERHLQNSRRKMLYNRMTKVKHRTLKQVINDHRSDIKVASTVSIVIATFVASWLPSFIAEMSYFKTVDSKKLINSYSLTSHIVFWMVYISPTLNPIIYAMHNTTIRHMVIRMIKDRKVYRTSTANMLGLSTTTATDPLAMRRLSTPAVDDNLDVVKNMNPVQPFRRQASKIVDMLKIQKTLKNNDTEDELSDEVIQEDDELFSEDEPSNIASVRSIISIKEENRPKKRVSLCLEPPTIHFVGETNETNL